jgi:hypothetical protein
MQARNILKYFARIGALRDGMVVLAMVRRLLFMSTSLNVGVQSSEHGSNETAIKKSVAGGTYFAEFGFGTHLSSPPAVPYLV